MKFTLKAMALLLCAFLFTKCTTDSITSESKKIGLQQQDDDSFFGKALINDTSISYSIKATSELVFDVNIEMGKNLIQATINYEEESMNINGHNAVLKEEEKENLLSLGSYIADYLLETKNGDILMTEYTLLSLIEYWGKSPINYQYTKRSITTEVNTTNLKSRNEGITCIKKNTYVNAQYDDSRGNHSDRVRVGSKARNGYECMGRCGAGCGRWWIPSAWTKDCMDHDQCSNVNNASGGSSDSNCGDEFNQAADDYIFGVIRGCRG